MVIACSVPHVAPWLALIGFLAITCWHRAYGKCPTCKTGRTPKCKCPGGHPDQKIQRPRFKEPK